MSQRLMRPPRFVFKIDPMKQSNDWNPRMKNERWRPPRPLGSNILVNDPAHSRAYEYYDGDIQPTQWPQRGWLDYGTFSFYYTNEKLYVFPDDATECQVADGDGSTRREGVADPEPLRDSDSDEDESDWNRLSVHDWRSLSFWWPEDGDGSRTSFAGHRQNHKHMNVLRMEQQHCHAISQLLPETYLHQAVQIPPTAAGSIPLGGLVGELPVLLALVAFSVDEVDVSAALQQCFRRRYVAHNRPRCTGCQLPCSPYLTTSH